jgi:HPt (histidine-containing phosphotransfer) domain-containing protein
MINSLFIKKDGHFFLILKCVIFIWCVVANWRGCFLEITRIKQSNFTIIQEFSRMSTKNRSEQVKEEASTVSVESVKKHLAESYELDISETETIVATYGEALQEYLQNLLQAVKEKNGEEGSAQAHGLKGACLNLGLPEQASKAEYLEKELSQNSPEQYEEDVEQLILELRPLAGRE